MITVSIDIGSVATKALLWSDRSDRIEASCQVPSAWQPKEAALEALRQLADKRPDLSPDLLAVTGYGRDLVRHLELEDIFLQGMETIPFNEITALAKGVNKVAPEARLILDVGGQDSKALSIDSQGRVIDFMLNDKCAAGAGAFIDSVCQSFNLSQNDFGDLAATGRPVALSSMCAVFAKTELVAQIARGVSRADLAAGILVSLAARLKTQCGRLFNQNQGALTGGLSRLPVCAGYLAESLGAPVVVPAHAPFLAALGAALLAGERRKSGKSAPEGGPGVSPP